MLIDDRITRVIEQTEKRYRERAEQRQVTEQRIRERRPLGEIDAPDRIALRKARLQAKGIQTPDEMVIERTLGGSDLMPINYLELGQCVARAVGRIALRDRSGRAQGYGSGFLVSPHLLLTNNHVFTDAEDAVSSLVEFNYEYHLDSQSLSPIAFRLDPDLFFVSHIDLDYSLVAVRDSSPDNQLLRRFGWIPLFEEEGKLALSEYVSIIQHPKGGPKQVAVRENQVVDRLENFLHYLTDTEPGSSGSPVFNDQWEVVALHHSGVPKRDGQGNIIGWVANEGVRISRIIKHLKSLNLPVTQSALRKEIFELPPPSPVRPETRLAVSAAPGGAAFWQAHVGEDGSAVWSIPLQVSVRIGLPPISAVPGHPPAAPVGRAAPAETPELLAALDELKESAQKPYYAGAQDNKDRVAYYKGIAASLTPKKLFQRLRELLEKTHRDRLKYQFGRQLYTWTDLQPNLKLRSIYSGIEFEPEDVIRESFRIEQERLALASEMRRIEAALSDESLDAALEAKRPYNCEHAVPQSWFGKKEPMRGDLHHLFTCEGECNSFRGNTPYFDFPEESEVIRKNCGKREKGAEAGLAGFEPNAGKGEVARTTLYFLLRYPGEITLNKEFTKERLKTMLAWHRDHPVTLHEKHRNRAIFKKQGNRNPLIDHPEWASRIDFSLGLG